MSLLGLFIYIVVIGLVVWLINAYTPIPPPFKTLILVLGIIVCLLLVLSAFGVIGSLSTPVPRIHS